MKYEKHAIRVSKGPDFIMIDLLSPDGKTTTSTELLGGIALSKQQCLEGGVKVRQVAEGNYDTCSIDI